MARKYVDCRETPSVKNCSLRISGEEGEVLDAAVHHMITVHEHEDVPELRDQVRQLLKPEKEGSYQAEASPPV